MNKPIPFDFSSPYLAVEVQATMRFPSDSMLRQAFLDWSILDFSLKSGLETITIGADAIERLLESKSFAEVNEHSKEAYKNGLIAGQLLLAVYQMEKFDLVKSPSLRKAIFATREWAKKHEFGDGGPINYSEEGVRSIWRQFNQVAHLWAAERLMSLYADKLVEPSNPDYFPLMLSIAAAIHAFGVSYVPLRSKTTLLDGGSLIPLTVEKGVLDSLFLNEAPRDDLLNYLEGYSTT